jgi:hypothetical protein
LATVAIHAARNSRLTSGKINFASGFSTMFFGGVGFVVTTGFLVFFVTGFLVAQEVIKSEIIKNNRVVALAKEYLINKF